MRGAHPLCVAASRTVSASIGGNLNTTMSGFARPSPAVLVLEPHDVVEVRSRNLQDGRVLEGADAVHRPRREVEGSAGGDDLLLEDCLSRLPELELGAPVEDVPA